MSRIQQIIGSCALWTVFVLASAILPYLMFGLGPVSDILDAALWVWIVGFLLQLGTVYLMNAAVGHQRVWPFLVASALPWVADWTIVLGGAVTWVVILVVIAVGVAMAWLPMRRLSLETTGRPVTAKVARVLSSPFNVVVNGVYLRRRVKLAIPQPDGTEYAGTVGMLCEIGTSPNVGDPVQLRVDAKNPRRFALAPPRNAGDRA